jgi:hypothetical protein
VVYEDTWERGKPIVFLFGSRPFAGGMCGGMETALSSMHAGRGPRSLTFHSHRPPNPNPQIPDRQASGSPWVWL